MEKDTVKRSQFKMNREIYLYFHNSGGSQGIQYQLDVSCQILNLHKAIKTKLIDARTIDTGEKNRNELDSNERERGGGDTILTESNA